MFSRLRPGSRGGGVDPEAVFHTNLLLLGYRDATPPGATPISVTPNMFDHANPVAFQQVFHFLLRTLDPEAARTEFRDCWPILDRKQEAEYRRKLVSWLKDLHKDFPQDVPYTNPSLFQSPGGRKFVSFLATFSSFVLKRCVERQRTKLAAKTTSKTSILREAYVCSTVNMETSSLQISVNNQVNSRKIYQKSLGSVNEISEKYLEMKTKCNKVSESENRLRDSTQTAHESETNRPNCDMDAVMTHCSHEYNMVNKLIEDFESFFRSHSSDWEGIVSAMDESLTKPKLNLTQYPPETMVGEQLKTIYENLLIKSLELAKKLTSNKSTHFPIKSKKLSEGVSRQATCLRELKLSLEGTVPEMVANVTEMQKNCSFINWSSSALAPSDNNETPPILLLPPTPKLVLGKMPSNDGSSPALSSRLKLVSPHPSRGGPTLQVPKQDLENPKPEVNLRLPETPTSGHSVNRRFNKKITSSHSPLLRTSLIQSTLRRVTPGDQPETPTRSADTLRRGAETPCRASDTLLRGAETPCRASDTLLRVDDTPPKGSETPVSRYKALKDSMDTFSPVLCSTKSPQNTASIQESEVLSSTKSPSMSASIKEKEENSRIDLNETESKIEMYKKFLKSVKKPQSPVADSASLKSPSLLDVWTSHKESLSPRRHRSTISEIATPKSNPRTLQKEYLDRVSPLFQASSTINNHMDPASSVFEASGGASALDGLGNKFSPRGTFRLSAAFSESLLESPQGSEVLDSLVTTRLDQLMNSLSVTGDDNLDLSLSRMTLGDLGDQLLSPHCP